MNETPELTVSERNMIAYAAGGNLEGMNRILNEEHLNINSFDEDGMTPLCHAAYAGHFKICKLLLSKGASVDATNHRYNYTPLMFAGIAGKIDVVGLLLEHGASTTKTNTVNKTSAQMAAFVGNHEIVKVMNNFIPLEEVEGFAAKIKGIQDIVGQIHKMAIMVNVHPVRLVMFIQENLCILEKAGKVRELFSRLAEKKFIQEENELLSLKFHHIAYILKVCQEFVDEKVAELSKTSDASKLSHRDSLKMLIKCWIKGDKKGFPTVLEKLLRQDVADYPFKDNSLFQELIRTLGPVKIGEEPSAVNIISEVTYEQRHTVKTTLCTTCGESSAEKKCSKCKSVYYCNTDCQKLHWFTHKSICPELAEKHKMRLESSQVEAQTATK